MAPTHHKELYLAVGIQPGSSDSTQCRYLPVVTRTYVEMAVKRAIYHTKTTTNECIYCLFIAGIAGEK